MREKIKEFIPEILAIISMVGLLLILVSYTLPVGTENKELKQENKELKTEIVEMKQDVSDISDFYDGFFEYLIKNEIQFDPNDEWQLVRLATEYLSEQEG